MDDNVLKILDNRTPFQASENYKRSIHNEKCAMGGLVTAISVNAGSENVWCEKIDEDEEWTPGEKYRVKPDYFLYVRKNGEVKKWSIEVKTTWREDFDNDIIVKAPQVWTCKNNPKKFSRPYVFACTYKEFALIPMASFWNGEVQDIKFGKYTKKGFLLHPDDYEWQSFVVPLKFRIKNERTNY